MQLVEYSHKLHLSDYGLPFRPGNCPVSHVLRCLRSSAKRYKFALGMVSYLNPPIITAPNTKSLQRACGLKNAQKVPMSARARFPAALVLSLDAGCLPRQRTTPSTAFCTTQMMMMTTMPPPPLNLKI